MIDKKLLKLYAKIELAKREFFFYCNLKAPDFYKADREYLKKFCRDLQSFYESDDEVLVVNMPPRHGKSRTAGLFTQWVLGKNRSEKIMTGSYNETLSTSFSKSVRDSIGEKKADKYKVVYSDIFKDTKIKRGDGAMNLWSLQGEYQSYLATSPSGTATGFGCSLMIIDDLIKNASEAYNADVLEKHWDWFTNTMLSRLEEGGKIIIIMTRWATGDLAGRALLHYKNQGAKIKHITLKAFDGEKMLCKEILSKKSYDAKLAAMGHEIASANYNQEPIDIKGRLYTSFKTYKSLPQDENGNLLFSEIRNYTDTADTGSDFLCSINYGVYDGEAYVLNVLYTKDSMEKTETETAEMLIRDGVCVCDVESNNGGRGFARAVERILREKGFSKTVINTFHQSGNKRSRILSNASWVTNHIYFPVNWADRFPKYFEDLNKYQKEGKNPHDDAPDATTGVAEKIYGADKFSFE